MINHSLSFALLQNGSYFAAVEYVFDSTMNGWWWFMLYVFTLAIIFIISKSEAATGSAGLLGAAFLLTYKASALPIAVNGMVWAILVLCIAMMLYKLFGRGD